MSYLQIPQEALLASSNVGEINNESSNFTFAETSYFENVTERNNRVKNVIEQSKSCINNEYVPNIN